MLKRARASTPPPASSTPDLLPMLPDEPSARHTTKRRRVLPPSLDGPSRGMNYAPTQPQQVPVDDDGEEYMDDDADEQDRAQLPVSQTYKAVNSLLHDLHAEHQHRRLWESPTSAPFAPAPLYSYSSASVVGTHSAQAARARSPQSIAPPINMPLRPKHLVDVQLPTPPPSIVQEEDAAMQYEDTNRLLREAFLNRRRQLSRS